MILWIVSLLDKRRGIVAVLPSQKTSVVLECNLLWSLRNVVTRSLRLSKGHIPSLRAQRGNPQLNTVYLLPKLKLCVIIFVETTAKQTYVVSNTFF